MTIVSYDFVLFDDEMSNQIVKVTNGSAAKE